MSNVELGCARALPVDGRSDVGAMGAMGTMGTMGMMGAPGAMVMDEMGAMWKRWELWHGRARYENMDTLRALSADIFE